MKAKEVLHYYIGQWGTLYIGERKIKPKPPYNPPKIKKHKRAAIKRLFPQS